MFAQFCTSAAQIFMDLPASASIAHGSLRRNKNWKDTIGELRSGCRWPGSSAQGRKPSLMADKGSHGEQSGKHAGTWRRGKKGDLMRANFNLHFTAGVLFCQRMSHTWLWKTNAPDGCGNGKIKTKTVEGIRRRGNNAFVCFCRAPLLFWIMSGLTWKILF